MILGTDFRLNCPTHTLCFRAIHGDCSYVLMDDTNEKTLGWIENLLLVALRAGERIRFPDRYDGIEDDTSKCVKIACEELDALGCPWLIQNRALSYINNVDSSNTWEDLHRRQISEIANEIVSPLFHDDSTQRLSQ